MNNVNNEQKTDKIKQGVLEILSEIVPVDNPQVYRDSYMARRSVAGRKLPPYYLVYFLFADLLGFRDLGRDEKVAWSFPLSFKGRDLFVSHRKFGLGIFVLDELKDETLAEELVKLITRAVSKAKPFFNIVAENAVKASKFNVKNNNKELYGRYELLLSLYEEQYAMYLSNLGKTEVKEGKTEFGSYTSYTPLDRPFQIKANHLAISCIEAFFSWTEHLFIHLAIVANNLSEGEEISRLIGAEWREKFNGAIRSEDKALKKMFNDLLIVRQQLRNFVAHGAFGKDGSAFHFHSGAGAVPVVLDQTKDRNRFSLTGSLAFDNEQVISLLKEFVDFLWKGDLRPAMYYSQENAFPAILPYAKSGLYSAKTKSMKKMEAFVEQLHYEFDNAGNMDW